MGLKRVNLWECKLHCSGPIDLLRESDKLILAKDELIQDKTLNLTVKQHHQDDIVVIMITETRNPSPKKFLHFTKDFVRDLFLKLWNKPNVNSAYSSYCLDYAQHAYKIYNEQVSLTRLLIEVKEIFPAPETLRRIYITFYTKYARQWMITIRMKILTFPFRQMGVDGTDKCVKNLKIHESHKKYDVKANVDFATAGSPAYLVNDKLYPGGRETHENISELLLEPMIISLKTSDTFKQLSYGIGIDHPDRDYAVGDTLIPLFVNALKGEQNSMHFTSNTGLKYDLSTASAFVKYFTPNA